MFSFDRIVNVLVMRVPKKKVFDSRTTKDLYMMKMFIYILGSVLSVATATVSGNVCV
jgi:hypothetical protein